MALLFEGAAAPIPGRTSLAPTLAEIAAELGRSGEWADADFVL